MHDSRVIIAIVHVGTVNTYVAAEGMKLSVLPILVEKLVWVPVILFCKISFRVTCALLGAGSLWPAAPHPPHLVHKRALNENGRRIHRTSSRKEKLTIEME
jgi:hypothetical protein